jgi:hypothetical protein
VELLNCCHDLGEGVANASDAAYQRFRVEKMGPRPGRHHTVQLAGPAAVRLPFEHYDESPLDSPPPPAATVLLPQGAEELHCKKGRDD